MLTVRSAVFYIAPLLALFAQNAESSEVAGAEIGIFLDFQHVPSKSILNAMKKEVAAVLSPTGLRLLWRSLQENRGTEAFANLAVLRFRGKCESGSNLRGEAPATNYWALGSTAVQSDRVTPYSNVECDRLRGSILFSSPGKKLENDRVFGRALGRIVAHELYHIVGKTKDHGIQGIAKARYTFSDLTAERFLLHRGDARAMRADAE